jgi:hypothetical protein
MMFPSSSLIIKIAVAELLAPIISALHPTHSQSVGDSPEVAPPMVLTEESPLPNVYLPSTTQLIKRL